MKTNRLSRNRLIGLWAAPLWVIVLAAQTIVAPSARAVVTISFQDVGSNLVATYSGTLNLTGLTGGSNVGSANVTYFDASAGPTFFLVNSAYDGDERAFLGGATKTVFGTSGFGSANSISSTSDTFGFDGSYVYVSDSFVSGSSLSGQMTFNGTSIAALGLIDGVTAVSWSGDSIVISTSAIPEPSTYAAIAGVAVLCATGYARRRQALAS